MIQKPPYSHTFRRSHWLLAYLRTRECEESGNQLTRMYKDNLLPVFSWNAGHKLRILPGDSRSQKRKSREKIFQHLSNLSAKATVNKKNTVGCEGILN